MINIRRKRSTGPRAARAAEEQASEELADFLAHVRGDTLSGAPEELAWPILLRARLRGLPTTAASRGDDGR